MINKNIEINATEEKDILKLYGCHLFSDEIMKERLPQDAYLAYRQAIDTGETLPKEIATVIANEMKNWAVEKGATHFTHWFVPLTGLTAEKHDAFIELQGNKPVLEFSGKLLRKGEPDASSFPSGGLRATFEARGYTAWDCTSPAFVKDGSLYIPTLFCSYTGEALDNKTPLLKSCDALNKEAVRLVKLLGLNEVTSVTAYVGSEQEYFLVSEEYFQKRLDLKLTGRTLFGAQAPKGQELGDHYFGSIKEKVAKYMKDLDEELWKFGIPAKTKHNESAPSQHELACIYRDVNITTDNNNLLMQVMQDIAKKHGLRCLLHEKPYQGVNGSGKHNNWSVVTNTGVNLFKPGANIAGNIPFLATVACLVKGVYEYADLLRLSMASAGNDHRLGGHEAPPAIISMFFGEEIDRLFDAIIEDKELKNFDKDRFQTGVSVIPDFAKDNADRNRTSPFAFTGNKFEFRGVGSSQSIANVNTMLNSILATEMKEMADLLESGLKPMDVIRMFLKESKKVIFSGDGYSHDWEDEAKRRGLPNRKDTVEAIECLKDKKMTSMLINLGVYTQVEIDSRYEVLLDNYCKVIQVEALTALKMTKNQFYPSSIEYLNKIANTTNILSELSIENVFLYDDVQELSKLIKEMKVTSNKLSEKIDEVHQCKDNTYEKAKAWRDRVIPLMEKLRKIVDMVETRVDQKCWPVPTYVDLLFGI